MFGLVRSLGFEWGGEAQVVHEAAGIEPVD
jgi:hypothetical protein